MLQDNLEGIFAPDGVLSQTLKGFRARPSQLAFALVVKDAIDNQSTVAVEAGTGTGKTFAYLIPALISKRQITITTASKTLQDQLFKKDVKILSKALSRKIDVAVLKGRANYVCRLRLDVTASSDRLPEATSGEKLREIIAFTKTTETGDLSELAGLPETDPLIPLVTSTQRNCLGAKCPHAEKCFVNMARERAAEADIVIVNHHLYLSDLVLKKSGAPGLLPESEVLVFDEAHKLSDIASDYFSESFSVRQLAEFADDIRRTGKTFFPEGAWDKHAKNVSEALLAFHDFLRVQTAFVEDVQIELKEIEDIHTTGADLLSEVVKAFTDYLNFFENVESDKDEAGLLELAKENAADLISVLRVWVLRLKDAGHKPEKGKAPEVLWARITEKNAILNLTPVSVREHFKLARATSNSAWIFTSATLSVKGEDGEPNFDFFLHELGLEDIAETHTWASSFDFENQAFLYLPEDLADTNDERFAQTLGKSILPLLKANPGKTFILCTSYEKMNALATYLEVMLENPDVICLQGTTGKAQLLERFKEMDGAVLIGSMSFWEGVDMKGENLRLVVIDKLPFKPFDTPVDRAREAFLKEQNRSPFMDYQLPVMIMTLRQGVGRLIRSEDDYGVVVIGDNRIAKKGYGKIVRASLPAMTKTRFLTRAKSFLVDPENTP